MSPYMRKSIARLTHSIALYNAWLNAITLVMSVLCIDTLFEHRQNFEPGTGEFPVQMACNAENVSI